MGSDFFMDKRLQRKFKNDVKKRSKLEKQERKHFKQFFKHIDRNVLNSLFDIVRKKGFAHEIQKTDKLEENIETGSLTSNDALELLDLYEKYVDELKE